MSSAGSVGSKAGQGVNGSIEDPLNATDNKVHSFEVSLVLEYCDWGCLRDALDGGAYFASEWGWGRGLLQTVHAEPWWGVPEWGRLVFTAMARANRRLGYFVRCSFNCIGRGAILVTACVGRCCTYLANCHSAAWTFVLRIALQVLQVRNCFAMEQQTAKQFHAWKACNANSDLKILPSIIKSTCQAWRLLY